MKLSTRGRYGLRVTTALAHHYGNGPIPVEKIAREEHISGKYIHLLMAGLRNEGLIRSQRGPNGGYELVRHPGSVTALQVIEALEGRLSLVECVTEDEHCHRSDGCPTRDLWFKVAAAMTSVLDGVTLEQLARQRGQFHTTTMDYSI